jgi:hypothetical protein
MSFQRKQTQKDAGLANKIDQPMDYEQAIIKQLQDIAEWADDLEETEMLLKYYYSVDYLYDLLSAWFNEHPDLLTKIDSKAPVIVGPNDLQMPAKRMEILDYTKHKFRVIMELLHREGLDKLNKKVYNYTDLDLVMDDG